MSASDGKPDRPIEFHRRDTSRLDAALRRQNSDAHTTDKNGLDGSRIPSPSSKSGVRPRRTFAKTSTLSGAFEATAPQQQQQQQHQQRQAASEEAENDRRQVARGTPSPSSRRSSGRNRSSTNPDPLVDVTSPPELQETYRQINDSDDLVNLVAQEDIDEASYPTQTDRRRRKSPNQWRERQLEEKQQEPAHNNDQEPVHESLSFPEDDTDDSFRRKLEMHAKDEQLLKRVTAKDSPVFSKARLGQDAPRASDYLQRRNEEGNNEARSEEDGPEPGLNIPKAWGGRGQASKERMNYISRRKMELSPEKPLAETLKTEPEPYNEPEPVQEWDNDIDFTARSLQVSDSPPVQQNFVPPREETNTLARKAVTANRFGELDRKLSQERIRPSIEKGDPIPNTPIVVYKNSPNYDKKTERTDSRDILRELAMRESPSISSSNTPEQKSPEKKDIMLTKTPVVTGAWIDTPMPEKVADLPEDLTKDIVSPSPSRSETKPEKQNEEEQRQALEQKPPSKSSPGQSEEAASKHSSQTQSEREHSTKTKPKAQRRELEKPKIPKSALETVLESAKLEDNALSLGEDTIDSLQGILDEEPTIFSPDEGNNDAESNGTSASLQTVTDTNAFAIDPLNTKLQSLIRSIHEAKKGLSSLERQITSEAPALSPIEKTKQQKKIKPHKTTAHDDPSCETCGLHDHDQRLYVALPLPRLWKRTQPSNGLRLTRLGYFLLITLTWCMVEFVLCEYYCHPFYAHLCQGNCLAPNTPGKASVFSTVLWRLIQLLLKPAWMIIAVVTKVALEISGLWAGFGDDGVGGAYWNNKPVRETAIPSEVPVMPSWVHNDPPEVQDWGSGLSMDEDEYV